MTDRLSDLPGYDPVEDPELDERWSGGLRRSLARRALARRDAALRRARTRRSGQATALMVAVSAGAVPTAVTAAPRTQGGRANVVLDLGDDGRDVTALQRSLGIAADGVFGPATQRAVRAFQRAHGLVADGIAGPATRRALARAHAPRRRAPARAVATAGILRAGDHGPAVAALQRGLGIAADGQFGPATERAVRAYQRAHHLTVDGLAGPATRRAALRHRASALTQRASLRTPSVGSLRTGDRSSRVSALQRALRIHVDGVFGPGTERAVRAFQARRGLTVDGIAGPATQAALGLRASSSGSTSILLRKAVLRSDGTAVPPAGAPRTVVAVIQAANRIARTPYRYGGGHGSFFDTAYDCSGSVSYALHGGGLLSSPLDSSALASYGAPGPGRWMTVYAHSGHAFLVVAGLRFDTSGAYGGSRWQADMRSSAGYILRHPTEI